MVLFSFRIMILLRGCISAILKYEHESVLEPEFAKDIMNITEFTPEKKFSFEYTLKGVLEKKSQDVIRVSGKETFQLSISFLYCHILNILSGEVHSEVKGPLIDLLR